MKIAAARSFTRRLHLSVAGGAAALCFVTVANAQTPPAPIRVDECLFTPGQPAATFYGYWGRPIQQFPESPTLLIKYANTSPKTATQIQFGLAVYGRLVGEVRDVGTFTTGAEIKHTFALDPNTTTLGSGLYTCIPLVVHYQDGSVWKHARPGAPAAQPVYPPAH